MLLGGATPNGLVADTFLKLNLADFTFKPFKTGVKTDIYENGSVVQEDVTLVVNGKTMSNPDDISCTEIINLSTGESTEIKEISAPRTIHNACDLVGDSIILFSGGHHGAVMTG